MVQSTPIVTASAATVACGLAAYFIWFDYRRRNDSDFRRELRRIERREVRTQREAEDEAKRQERESIRQMAREVSLDDVPTDPMGLHDYMLGTLDAGQKAIESGADPKACALYFYKALIIAQDKASIASIYDEQLPKSVLNILSMMIVSNKGLGDELVRGAGLGRVSVNDIPAAGPD